MPFVVTMKPLLPRFQFLWLFLIGASRVLHVMVVDVVDGDEVDFRRGADVDWLAADSDRWQAHGWYICFSVANGVKSFLSKRAKSAGEINRVEPSASPTA